MKIFFIYEGVRKMSLRIDCCGTPAIFFSKSQHESPILYRWYLFVRLLHMNEEVFEPRPTR